MIQRESPNFLRYTKREVEAKRRNIEKNYYGEKQRKIIKVAKKRWKKRVQ